jgi:hypothetical protein
MLDKNMSNLTRAFLGDEMSWEYTRVILRDVHGLWGGRNIFIEGSGFVLLQRVSPTQDELRYEFELSHALITSLLVRFIEHDFLGIHLPESEIPPDSTIASITLVNPLGHSFQLTKPGNVEHAGFSAIYDELLRIESSSQQLEPIYIGPYAGEPG